MIINNSSHNLIWFWALTELIYPSTYLPLFTMRCKVLWTFLLLYYWKTTRNLQLVEIVDLDPVISLFIVISNKFFYIQNKQTDIYFLETWVSFLRHYWFPRNIPQVPAFANPCFLQVALYLNMNSELCLLDFHIYLFVTMQTLWFYIQCKSCENPKLMNFQYKIF